jgi:hypothetical protein
MDNEFLGRLHLDNKRRRKGEQEEQVVEQQQQRFIMCIDLSNEENDRQNEQGEPEPPVVVQRLLPLQDIQFLEEADEEFSEVITVNTSKDRMKKGRGKDKNPIFVSEDMRCDCKVKCLEGYECYAGKHVMCVGLVTKDMKCYLCGSRIV